MNENPNTNQSEDQQAEELITERLEEGPGLEDIHAKVVAGVATLSGRVKDDVDKLRADKVARAVGCIHETVNLIQVDPHWQAPERPDLDPEPRGVMPGELDEALRRASVNSENDLSTLGRTTPGDVDVVNVSPFNDVPVGMPVTGNSAPNVLQGSGQVTGAEDLAYQVKAGMSVFDRDGKTVGTVKTVRRTDFLLNRAWARDVFVPYFECKLEDDHLLLHNIASYEIDDQGWAISPSYF